MQKIAPFLWYNDQAEEAIKCYTGLFKQASVESITRFGDEVPGPKGKVITATFQLAGKEFMALNGGPEFTFTPALSLFVNCQTEAEVDSLWAKLSDGGAILMELGAYPFSKKFGWLADRYGLSWQINLAGIPQEIAPFLMFTGQQHGKAEQAIHFYTSLFKNSSISQIQRFGKDQGEPEGTVMHARFVLDGRDFMAMDSGLPHGFTFTPAFSFFIHCENQDEVDYFWEKLSEGGHKDQCGWLTDPFGVSWQVVPNILGELMSDPDPEKARRVTQAMLQMSKLDINRLKQAYMQG